MKYPVICAHCGETSHKEAGLINRARDAGAPLYCNKVCAGLARRRKVPLTDAERKEAKRIYDAQRRETKGDELRAKKMAHYYANHERLKAEHAVYRAAHMARHVEYCRRPEYRVKKAEYDRRKRFEAFGPFADAAMLLESLEKEISTRASRYEIYIANGRFTRSAQQRRRELWQSIQRN